MQLSTLALLEEILQNDFDEITGTLKHLQFQKDQKPKHRVLPLTTEELETQIEPLEELWNRMFIALEELKEEMALKINIG